MKRFLPIVDWLPAYDRLNLRWDIFAALTVWAIVVPESMAYASIAGMPPETGLYAATAPLLAYVIFGTSRRITVGPTAATAAVSASTIYPLAGGDPIRFVQLSVLLALLAGIFLVIGGLLKFGAIAKFLSRPVLAGFLVGVAIDIVLGQAGKLFGIEVEGEGFFRELGSLVTQLDETHLLTLAVGIGSLVVLWGSHKLFPKFPATLVLVVLAIAVSTIFNLAEHGLHVVGEIPSGLPSIAFPEIDRGDIAMLIPGALAIALVGFTETIAVAQSFGSRHNERVDPDQEMLAIGASNIAGGFTGAFFTNGSTSRTAAADKAGQRTQLSSLIVVALLVVTMLFLTPVFQNLPEATLGAIVIHAVWSLIRTDDFVRLWRVYRADSIAAVATLLGVLVLGVLPGLAIGVAISLGALMARAISPNTARLAFDPETQKYLSMEEHPDLDPPEGIAIIRFDAPLFFANDEAFSDEIERAFAEPSVEAVIVDARGITDIDTTALATMKELRENVDARGQLFEIAEVRERLFPIIHEWDPEAAGRLFPSIAAAVEAIQENEDWPPSAG